MDGLARSTFALLLVSLVSVSAGTAMAEDRPPNVDDAAHEWLAGHVDDAMPFLLQTSQGPIDQAHISIVEELGNWGAARARGKHQGNDFVLDFPHEAGTDRVLVGSIMAGRVVHLERDWGSYGHTLFVHREIAPHFVMIYAHLDELDVEIGDTVEVGDLVGSFGCTGNCKGLAGKHVRNQVHVELYAMPADFVATDITWESMPMRQLRNAAIHDRGKAHGVDIRAYFDAYRLEPVTRAEHGERWAHHAEHGGFAAYLADEDVASAMALAAEPPVQDGAFEGEYIPEPDESFYYDDDSLPEDLVAREVERHNHRDDTAQIDELVGVVGLDGDTDSPRADGDASSEAAFGSLGTSLGARMPSRLRSLARRAFGRR